MVVTDIHLLQGDFIETNKLDSIQEESTDFTDSTGQEKSNILERIRNLYKSIRRQSLSRILRNKKRKKIVLISETEVPGTTRTARYLMPNNECNKRMTRRQKLSLNSMQKHTEVDIVGALSKYFKNNENHFVSTRKLYIDGGDVSLELPTDFTKADRDVFINQRFTRRNAVSIQNGDMVKNLLNTYITSKHLMSFFTIELSEF